MNLAPHRRVPTSSCINSSRGCRTLSRSSTLARFVGVALVIAAVAGCTGAAEQDPNLTVALLATPVAVTVNSVSTGRPYAPVSAVPGVAYYIDRGFRIGSLSAALNGGTLIKTANDDKNVTATNHLRFTPAAAATVYVGMDRRTTRLPSWLDSTWRLTTESFVSNGDGAASPMKMYAKDFARGVIQLGGNKQSPAAGTASNYVVVVVARATSTGTGGSGTGGSGTGGSGTGGSATGGRGSGGAGTGGAATGGANTGGAATGGANTGGAATGGANTGGANTGGAATGGSNTGGANTGGAATGGSNTGGANTGGAATGGAGTGGAAGSGVASLYVVAHPDDELLFMNPDLEGAIQAGGIVVTAYATSGDGGDPNGPWAARESSVRAAHAGMAGVANTWSCGAATYAGKPTVKCTLTGKPSVRMVFLRLLDGFLNDLPIGKTVGTADGSTTYTGAQFTATLAAIQSEIQAQRVGTLDGTRAYGSDHEDHITSAFFAFDVARADGVARQITMYRGYSMYEPSFVGPPAPAPEAENLSAAQYQEKLRIIQLYQAPPLDDPFDQWCHRRYSISASSGGLGPLHSAAGQCLQASGTTDGSAVVRANCNGTVAQNWTATTTNQVISAAGKCLGLGADGNSAVVKTCGAAADQRWTLLANGQVHGAVDKCLTTSSADVFASTCQADTSASHYVPLVTQRWNF